MSTGPEKPPVFRPPSCGAQSRTELPKAEQPSLVEVLQELRLSGGEELFFMQLPDCMPGRTSAQKVDPALRSAAEKPAKKDGKTEDKRAAHQQAQVSS